MSTVKYHQSDDGTQVDGKTVVWISVPKEDVAWVEEQGEETEAEQHEQGGAAKETADKKKDGSQEKHGDSKAKKKPAQQQKKKVAASGPHSEAVNGKSPLAKGKNAQQQQKVEMAKLTAKALTSAARDGTPFCEECEKARQELEAKKQQQR